MADRHARAETGPAPPGITREEWAALKDDLIELERRGALDGIRAIVAERLRMARGQPSAGTHQGWARAGAQMAADIDGEEP